MSVPHVFVETNWIFACFSPRHRRKPDAERLLTLAASGALFLHVPMVALTEGAATIRKKCQPRGEDVVSWFEFAREQRMLTDEQVGHVRAFLNEHKKHVHADLDGLDDELNRLRTLPGVDVFPLSDAAFERIAGLRPASLEPFDEAILAAVLARASEVRRKDSDVAIVFCTLDSHLVPGDMNNLVRFYEPLLITVRQSFAVPEESR